VRLYEIPMIGGLIQIRLAFVSKRASERERESVGATGVSVCGQVGGNERRETR
jgi:hypothetical protein